MYIYIYIHIYSIPLIYPIDPYPSHAIRGEGVKHPDLQPVSAGTAVLGAVTASGTVPKTVVIPDLHRVATAGMGGGWLPGHISIPFGKLSHNYGIFPRDGGFMRKIGL